MKKLIALLMALTMCFVLCACGGKTAEKTDAADGEDESTTEAEDAVSYNFGDSITTGSGMFVFTPSFDGFAHALNNVGGEYCLTPEGSAKKLEESTNPYRADEGKIMMYFSADLEYIGDSKETEIFSFTYKVDYDGYVFDSTSSDLTTGMGFAVDPEIFDFDKEVKFEPLSSDTSRYVRFCIEVPEKVATDTDRPTSVIFTIGGEEYSFIADIKAAAEAKAAKEAAAEAEKAEKLEPVSEELASEIKDKLQGTWEFTNYGSNNGKIYTITQKLTFSGATISVQTQNSLINSPLANTGTYEVKKGYIELNFVDGSQALIPYEYENGELSMSQEIEGYFYSL